MNIIIVGAGEIGRHIADDLSTHAHNICVIDELPQLIAELNEKLDVRTIPANGASVTTLEEANIASCDLLLALTSDDSANLVIASLGKALGAAKTIARVHAGVQREEWLFSYRTHFNIDYLFSSERLAAVELAKFIRNPDAIVVEEIARGRIELQQVRVAPGSKSSGKTLRMLALPSRVRVGCIQRSERTIIPSAEEVLEVNDVVTLLGDPRKLADAVPLFHNALPEKRKDNIVIFGGNECGFALAQMLEAGDFRVRIIERNPVVCQELSRTLQTAVIINADATSLQQLREEQIGDADFLVAVTGDDEDNVMTCLQASNLGTKHCLAVIHRADYADAISRMGRQIGIFAAVSPREAAKRDLLRFVTSDKYHVAVDLGGDTRIIQSVVSEKSSAAGKKVSEVTWPAESGLVALLHGTGAIVPAADDVIAAGDVLYGIVTTQSLKPFVKLLTA